MKKPLLMVSYLVLACLLTSSLLCARGVIDSEVNRMMLLLGTIIWFVVTPFWMKKDSK
jgi:hypothetical protein